jgi:NodT family efflux transporter outer membrane factor (OMF) lipoprotein
VTRNPAFVVRALSPARSFILPAAALLLLSACTVGPNYKRPTTPAAPAFKEQPPLNFKEADTAGWKQAQPGDSWLKGKWWELYQDPALNALEEQVPVNNQNLAQAEALFRQAKTTVRVSRAALFPTVNGTASAAESRTAAVGIGSALSILPVEVAWEPDLWGNIRRGVTAAAATAQSFAANAENARLLYQSELAQDYFLLHGTDNDIDLLQRTVASFQEFLTLTRNRYNGGVASDLDVAQAEAQLYNTQASLIELGVQRAQFEHAIAILTGKTPSEVTIPPALLATLPPPVPLGVPSELLERRPDIAASERRVAAANEQIGIAMSAFYPNLTLTASAGLVTSALQKLIEAPARVWSLGAGLTQEFYDAGRRRAIVEGQQAAYDATVAAYRQNVLDALQQVEDNLAALRILEVEAAKIQENIASSDRALTVSTAQYRAGTTNYLTVLVAQASLLNAQRSAVSLQIRRLTASVQLIQALGGGWNASQLPSRQSVSSTR